MTTNFKQGDRIVIVTTEGQHVTGRFNGITFSTHFGPSINLSRVGDAEDGVPFAEIKSIAPDETVYADNNEQIGEDFPTYLRRVASDYRESDPESATAEDYEEAAKRIDQALLLLDKLKAVPNDEEIEKVKQVLTER